jgi:uncharacterized protein
MNIPTTQQCLELLRSNNTPRNIIEHCQAVSAFAVSLAEKLEKKGVRLNKRLVEAAALLHDIEKLKLHHIKAGYDFILSHGYPEVAETVKTHGLENLNDPSFVPTTIEQKIVFYSDKRIHNTATVPLKQRFDYIRKRYNTPEIEHDFMIAQEFERELTLLLGEQL